MNRTTAFLWGGLAIATAALTSTHFFAPLPPQHLAHAQAQLTPELTELSESPQLMTTEQLGLILADVADNVDGQAGQWQFELNGVSMVLITNDDHDRMRLVAPIIPLSRLTNEQREKMLFANFHTTLDARYAIGTFGGQPAVVSMFVHPLSSLMEEDFQSALEQVSRSAQTFGTTYSSGELLLSPNGTPSRNPELDDVGV